MLITVEGHGVLRRCREISEESLVLIAAKSTIAFSVSRHSKQHQSSEFFKSDLDDFKDIFSFQKSTIHQKTSSQHRTNQFCVSSHLGVWQKYCFTLWTKLQKRSKKCKIGMENGSLLNGAFKVQTT